MTTIVSGGLSNIPAPRGRVAPATAAPPTVFGRAGSTELVAAGYDVARRAIGKALERVPFEDATRALAELADRRDDVLRMAEDHLGYATFDVPLAAQVDALLLVGHARARISAQHAKSTLVTRLRRTVCPGS